MRSELRLEFNYQPTNIIECTVTSSNIQLTITNQWTLPTTIAMEIILNEKK